MAGSGARSHGERERRAAHQHAGEPRDGVGDSNQRGTDDRAAYAASDRAGDSIYNLRGDNHMATKSNKTNPATRSTDRPRLVDVTEQKRLNDARELGIPWKKWGPYL